MDKLEKEIRTITTSAETPIEIRAKEDGTATISGYAAVFNSFSEDLGGFREIIRPGAFRSAIASGQDVRALIDHNDAKLLGRNTSGTLRLSEDTKGLRYEVDTPDVSYARDLAVLMKRGDVTKSSFAFTVSGADGERWRQEGDAVVRELHNVNLFDVSVVTSYPAYNATSAAVRSLEKFKEEQKTPAPEENKAQPEGIETKNAEEVDDLGSKRLRLTLIDKGL